MYQGNTVTEREKAGELARRIFHIYSEDNAHYWEQSSNQPDWWNRCNISLWRTKGRTHGGLMTNIIPGTACTGAGSELGVNPKSTQCTPRHSEEIIVRSPWSPRTEVV